MSVQQKCENNVTLMRSSACRKVINGDKVWMSISMQQKKSNRDFHFLSTIRPHFHLMLNFIKHTLKVGHHFRRSGQKF